MTGVASLLRLLSTLLGGGAVLEESQRNVSNGPLPSFTRGPKNIHIAGGDGFLRKGRTTGKEEKESLVVVVDDDDGWEGGLRNASKTRLKNIVDYAIE